MEQGGVGLGVHSGAVEREQKRLIEQCEHLVAVSTPKHRRVKHAQSILPAQPSCAAASTAPGAEAQRFRASVQQEWRGHSQLRAALRAIELRWYRGRLSTTTVVMPHVVVNDLIALISCAAQYSNVSQQTV